MIDTRKLKELVRLMVENDLSELDLRDQEEKVTIRRGPQGAPVMQYAPAAPAPGHAPAPAAAPSDNGDAGDHDPDLAAIESPMVGTFYSKPSPDADAFASVGDSVSAGKVVCIVEAMKVFNEIKSEVSGTIEKMLVKDGDAVEFGQKMFLVRPS
ncbi:MAG: acetyl-CoA carboxylase biotin carboxyl carrier protein subunit [Phycisphaeraceae bacterium]|nr:MAG: acetyl-CoA carboxylase biotin carboxyl carrier protein subunit [Phycisphaeraceae bacterium]